MGDLLISHPVWSVLHATRFGLLRDELFPNVLKGTAFWFPNVSTTNNSHRERSPAIPRFDRSVILIVAVDGLTGIKGLCLNKSQAFLVESVVGRKKQWCFLTFSWMQRDTKGKPLLGYLKFNAYKHSSKIVRSILIRKNLDAKMCREGSGWGGYNDRQTTADTTGPTWMPFVAKLFLPVRTCAHLQKLLHIWQQISGGLHAYFVHICTDTLFSMHIYIYAGTCNIILIQKRLNIRLLYRHVTIALGVSRPVRGLYFWSCMQLLSRSFSNPIIVAWYVSFLSSARGKRSRFSSLRPARTG